MKRVAVIVAIVVVVALASVGYQRLMPGIAVQAARASLGPMREFVDEQAVTRLPDDYVITMPFDGRIMPIELVEGTPVSQGQIVARTAPIDRELQMDAAQRAIERLQASIRESADTSVERTALEQVRSYVESMDRVVEAAAEQVRASEAQVDFAERNLGRIRELRPTGAATQQELEQAELSQVEANVSYRQDLLVLRALQAMQAATNLTPSLVQQYIERRELGTEVLERQRAEAEINLRQAERDQQRGVMTSPIDGVVLERHVSNERPVAAGTVLLTIGDLSQLEVEADILSQDVVDVTPGDTVEIYGPAIGRPTARGTVATIYPAGFTKISSLGVEQQRVKVIVRFLPEELERLRSERDLGVGYRVNVRIFTAEKPRALVIPRSALFRGTHDEWQVFAIEDGIARLRPVEVGLMNDQQVEITSGLSEGDLVILAPETTLTDATRVEPVIRAANQ